MVNYCCVDGCGRNSKIHKNLIFYTLPKEKKRQIKWLQIAGREDLLEKDLSKFSKRFCSRHFLPSSIKNKHLCPDATPSLFLPGSLRSHSEDDVEKDDHSNILCNSCHDTINGFRYKCITCPDVDLCQKCEMLEAHNNHCMLRIPKPIKFTLSEKLVNELKSLLSTELDSDDNGTNRKVIEKVEFESSDDEPITKYVVVKQHNSVYTELTDDVKAKIRKEIARVLNINRKIPKKKTGTKRKLGKEVENSKRLKSEKDEEVENVASVPELAFADVNDIIETQIDIKQEESAHTSDFHDAAKPVAHVKVSSDLSELMIEVLQDQKSESMYE